jgi:hypothetical protein
MDEFLGMIFVLGGVSCQVILFCLPAGLRYAPHSVFFTAVPALYAMYYCSLPLVHSACLPILP